ncbi:MAG TPA: NYN domain-containing protein [Leptolyngbyaceae cyanobacterium M65_K2018_010]|nr:NYN domain-containing protein [Leptolyngbyaceae cyanobacterium M65_K2018_010]
MASSDYVAKLLVDGYNIMGAWPQLVRIKQQAGFEAARRELVEVLANYSARKGLDTAVIFDAYRVRSPTHQDVITANLSVCYTAYGQTADSYIERLCAELLHRPARSHRVIVATSDRAHQLTVVGYGAEWMSARQLERDVQHLHHQTQQRLQRRPQPTRHSILSGLDEEAREKLTRLRFGQR